MTISTMTTTQEAEPTTANDALGPRFLDALGRRDFGELETLLAPNLWFRALLPRKQYEHKNAPDSLNLLRSWFGEASELIVLATDHHRLATREFILYRFLLRPDWAPAQWHVIEQVGFLRVKQGRISRLDLVCTGFFPSDELGTTEAEL